ncbi:Hypothetical predicted protein [Lecanosticta acicola]|uniref:Uncharacterized protein n=1 Tax=Lecanosticta acicola TaxID=111012 RepID=A0AAI8YXQ5_9PEZI|nr:Hypothetical predicted protein [Lecanosticta acicola]
MSVSPEIHVGISACLDDITRAFKDGQAIIEKIKKKRALKRAPPPPRLLEESIDDGPNEIEREKQRGWNRFGKAFEDGDHLAVIALQQVTIQLQSKLLEKLRNAAFDDDSKITDFTYLVDAADTGRDRTIAVLHELKQRLIAAQNTGEEATVSKEQPQPRIVETSATPNSSGSNVTTPTGQVHRERAISAASITKQPAKHHNTWSRDFTDSRDASGEENAAAGAEDSHHHRKRNSLLGFLKHHRAHSDLEKLPKEKNAPQQPIVEEPARKGSTTSSTGVTVPYRPPPQCDASAPSDAQPPQSKFQYAEWEDNPEEIWGSKPHLDRRETVALAPDQPSANPTTSFTVNLPHQPPPPVMTNRTNSVATYTSIAHQHHPSTAIPTPTPENEFLGFCKGAWKLQNGDRKGSMSKCKDVEPWSRHPSAHSAAASYLACQQQRCAFRSSFSNADVNVIWKKVFTLEAKGIRLRWQFLAKSHVLQRVVVKHQYSFKCLFCVFTTGKSGVYLGMDFYLDHISSTHRPERLSEVILYKTGCINDRIAGDEEDFDICLYPMTAADWERDDMSGRKQEGWLSDDLVFGGGGAHHGRDSVANDSMFSNEPWNEGLSDFHYGDKWDGVEIGEQI